MPRDLSLPLREAIVTTQKADTALTALVPADDIHGMRPPANPTWPFTRYGTPDVLPAGKGSRTTVTLHGFSKAEFENEVAQIMAAMVDLFDGKGLVLEDNTKVQMKWRGTQILPDPAEASAWHGLARFEALIVEC